MEGLVREGEVLAGKYRVEHILGEGGMGQVVAAWHIELEQRVAIKFLFPELAEQADAAERFRREARAAVKIKSEHVARVIDVGALENGVPYMVMEFLEGNDLAEELRSRQALPVEEACGFILEASEAIAEAHAAGIVHRDLKPANLFISQRPDGQRMIKVLDFGISKSLTGGTDLQLTKTAAIVGSPLYMSPEQMDSAKDVDPRTDIWAIGVILFEMLAGRPPYTGQSIPQLCAAVLSENPTPLTELRSDVSPELDAVVQRCLSKSLDARWQSVAEVVTALLPFAPAASSISVDRVVRLLSGMRLETGLPANLARDTVRMPTGPGGSGRFSVTPSGEVKPSSSELGSAVPVVPGVRAVSGVEPTVASWGQTNPEPTKKRNFGLPLSVFIGTLVLAGGIAGFMQTQNGGSEEPAAPAAAPAAVTPLAPPEPEIVPATEPAAAAPATPSAEPVEAGAPAVNAPAKPAAAPRPARPARPARPTKTGPSDLSDFGGRR